LLGLCGSDHAGERANAAQMADRLVRANGMTWADIIVKPPQHRAEDHLADDWRVMRDYCAARSPSLRSRECDFVADLAVWRGRLSNKQTAWLIAIYTRLQREAS
jgi:hypothetical protein